MKYYAIVIDTDQYAGNFEREMASYCTSLEFPRGNEYCDDEDEYADWWTENTYEHYNGEWDEGCCIWPTPGWSNSGMGHHHRLKEGEQVKWPAYMSVAIFCREKPPADVIEEVKQRAMAFNAVYQANESGRPENVTVERIRVIEINKATTVTEIEIEV